MSTPQWGIIMYPRLISRLPGLDSGSTFSSLHLKAKSRSEPNFSRYFVGGDRSENQDGSWDNLPSCGLIKDVQHLWPFHLFDRRRCQK
jgi:hypothetical protein